MLTTNHKDIGTLYLLFAFTMLIIGGILALLIRAELFQPGLQLVNPELFNQLTTMHGLIMVFGFAMSMQAKDSPAQTPVVSAEEWERRKAGNLRLAWVFVGVAVALFALALWKYRPL